MTTRRDDPAVEPPLVPARVVPAAVAPSPPTHRPVPAGGGGAFEPIDLLRALRRRWPLALGAGLALAAIVAPTVYMLMPPARYAASARLLVSSVAPAIIFKTRESVSDFGAYQRTQLGLIRTRKVLGTALKDEDVARLGVVRSRIDPVDWLERELQVEFVNGSEILRIGMNGDDPEVPMRIVNAVVEAYLNEVVEEERKTRRQRYELLKTELNRYQESLRERRREMRRLTEAAGSDDKKVLASIQSQELERLSRAEEELARVQSELRSLRVESEVLEGVARLEEDATDPAAVEEEIENDQVYAGLRDRAAESWKAYQDASRLVRSRSDPAVVRHLREFEAARAEQEAYARKLRPLARRRVAARSRESQGNQAETIGLRMKILSGLESVLKDETSRLEDRSKRMSRTVVDLNALQQDIATAEEVARSIGSEVELLNVELQSPPRVRKIESAELPRTKDESGPIRMAMLSGLGAFAIGFFGVGLWEFRARRVDSTYQITQGLGVRVVGALPLRPDRGRLGRLNEARVQLWQNRFSESVDAARTVILHHARTQGMRVVMVTSALPGEGKTSLASHLALSLARAGRPTLLIDGDFRRPKVHRLFEHPIGPGLSDVLRGEAAAGDVTFETPAHGLHLIPAGEADPGAIQALSSFDLRGMLDGLLGRFELIVVDTPPVLPVVDALLIGQHVDAALLSVMRSVSRLPAVQEAHSRLEELSIPVLGAVVTGVAPELRGSSYAYQYMGSRRPEPLDPGRGDPS